MTANTTENHRYYLLFLWLYNAAFENWHLLHPEIKLLSIIEPVLLYPPPPPVSTPECIPGPNFKSEGDGEANGERDEETRTINGTLRIIFTYTL